MLQLLLLGQAQASLLLLLACWFAPLFVFFFFCITLSLTSGATNSLRHCIEQAASGTGATAADSACCSAAAAAAVDVGICTSGSSGTCSWLHLSCLSWQL
jgi:hypothetical protein